jgi:DNA-binding NtrC family response regulator
MGIACTHLVLYAALKVGTPGMQRLLRTGRIGMENIIDHVQGSLQRVALIRKVLIFDEDVEDLARHAEPFEAHGFEVHKCASVESAMRSVEREDFDLALVDQGSKDFEGLRVLRHLIRYNSHTPFIVMTRRKEMLCCRQALTLGAMNYLEKPVPRAEMDWIIRIISEPR